MTALIAFVIALADVRDTFDVDGPLIVVAAFAAAAPLGLVVAAPALGWLVSAAGALVVSRAMPVVDGDPWPWPVIHGLVLLALVFATGLSVPAGRGRLRRAGVSLIATTATAVLFGVSVPDELRAGWSVGAALIGLAGVVMGLTGLVRTRRPPPPDVVISARDVPAALLAGFREAFVDWVPSPPTGRPFAERLLSSRPWAGRVRTASPWILALGVFWLGVGSFHETIIVHDLVLPILAAAIALPIGLARQYALIGWRLITLVAIVVAVIGTPSGGQDPGTWPVAMQFVWLAMTFLVAVRHQRATVAWVWAVTVASQSAGTADNAGVAITLMVTTSALALIGDLMRTRRLASHEVERQTELSQLERARRTVLEERTRIARDLHDVVAHHMSMVVVQAETAPYRIPDLSPAAADELASISASARQALNEVRSMLGVLRATDQVAPTTPQPGLEQIEDLVDNVRRSGVHVRLHMRPPLPDVGAAAGLSIYRIMQESLANAARHAPGSDVHVYVGVLDDAVDLRVLNSAPPAGAEPAPARPARSDPDQVTTGHGLIGMRERASVVGGTFEAGANADGGFEVHARIPVHDSPRHHPAEERSGDH
ncbi:sensor histidine kinase [Phytoactinopolyspora limicola]|uniref:sensor histidine kinase n=1 Tax=Phytoactinopolyspora limicola TaxID=2715536 RepID=UPI0014094B52|nr:histidine kinase [Phytoactinopolyspora limicola]